MDFLKKISQVSESFDNLPEESDIRRHRLGCSYKSITLALDWLKLYKKSLHFYKQSVIQSQICHRKQLFESELPLKKSFSEL